MKTYLQIKNKVRNDAITWQNIQSRKNCSYEEIIIWQEYLQTMAKRYGLLKEFKENGVL
jgi:hypothetical protein